METSVYLPAIGEVSLNDGFLFHETGCDGLYTLGKNGVTAIASTRDEKVTFVAIEGRTLAYIPSATGYPAVYPVHPVKMERPVKAVLMDLDGTSVKSEEFWIWIIQKTVSSLLKDNNFSFVDDDIPYVSGHSVTEHLEYCIRKYTPGSSIVDARDLYYHHTQVEMDNIREGRGNVNAFTPAEGLKDFLLELKAKKIKIGLVTSGLYEKAWPEILSAFTTLDMGDPTNFYDAIVTSGSTFKKGQTGTVGELCSKPHPWLYAETATIGMGLDFSERNHVVGIEDSAAGVVSLRLAGFSTIGVTGGNIEAGGAKKLCTEICPNFTKILELING